MERWLMPTILIAVLTAGCSRKIKSDISKISIRAPKSLNAANKTGGVGAMAAMPSDRKACYAVSVTGSSIPSDRGNICNPTTGLRAGFVEPGGLIQLEVPRGPARKIELLAFLQPTGQNNPCPPFNAALTDSQLQNTFIVGTADNVDMSSDVVDVTIDASFPGLTQHIAQVLALPLTCSAAVGDNPPGFHVSAGEMTATGTGLILKGRVGRAVANVASGGGITLKAK
ncbi:MAG: hypothetical protein AB7F86_14910 [Bdellovibrionales bacterium]